MSYEIVKAVHLITVMSWMAGLLYLPRLFVYHSQSQIGSLQSETFKVMERRLLKAIMNPAMILTFLLGIWMLWVNPALWQFLIEEEAPCKLKKTNKSFKQIKCCFSVKLQRFTVYTRRFHEFFGFFFFPRIFFKKRKLLAAK